jgi:hypothetical protein
MKIEITDVQKSVLVRTLVQITLETGEVILFTSSVYDPKSEEDIKLPIAREIICKENEAAMARNEKESDEKDTEARLQTHLETLKEVDMSASLK